MKCERRTKKEEEPLADRMYVREYYVFLVSETEEKRMKKKLN